VAHLAARLILIDPSLTPAEVRALILNTSEKVQLEVSSGEQDEDFDDWSSRSTQKAASLLRLSFPLYSTKIIKQFFEKNPSRYQSTPHLHSKVFSQLKFDNLLGPKESVTEKCSHAYGDVREVLVVDFKAAMNQAEHLLKHPEQRREVLTPPFLHGNSKH
jgi:hypothetical protein